VAVAAAISNVVAPIVAQLYHGKVVGHFVQIQDELILVVVGTDFLVEDTIGADFFSTGPVKFKLAVAYGTDTAKRRGC